MTEKDKKQNENIVKQKDEQIGKLSNMLEKMELKMQEMEKKIKYAPKPAQVPKEQQGLPRGIQESQIKTVVRDMSDFLTEKMLAIKDLATLELLMDTGVRMKNRLQSIREVSTAKNIKIRGHWKTTPPDMYISNLQSKRLNNDEYEISFGVFETDDKGDKVLYTHYADVLLHDGSVIKRATSAEYRIGYEIVEKIKTGKAITREVLKIDAITK